MNEEELLQCVSSRFAVVIVCKAGVCVCKVCVCVFKAHLLSSIMMVC